MYLLYYVYFYSYLFNFFYFYITISTDFCNYDFENILIIKHISTFKKIIKIIQNFSINGMEILIKFR